MVTVSITYRIYEEIDARYTAPDEDFSEDCWAFMHKAIDNRPPRNKARSIAVTQKEINAVCDEFLRSVVNLQFGETCVDRAEQSMRDRHGNAVLDFITTYYQKGI